MSGFVHEGLARGQRVLYVTGTGDPPEVLDLLRVRDGDVAAAVDRGQLVVASAAAGTAPGPFDPGAVVAGVRAACERGLADGCPGLRLVGDLGWAERQPPDAERLLEYELRLEAEVYAELPLTGVCLYDRRAAPVDLLAAAHPRRLSEGGPAGRAVGEPPLAVAPLSGNTGLRLLGDADLDTRPVLTAALEALARIGGTVVRLDLSAVGHLDVAAVGALVRTTRALREQGRRLVLVEPPETLRRTAGFFPEECSVLEPAP
ncbi:hypothetical protein SCATT_p11600 (plasmid) [Streptantibioticus cattleyicolor NRRL 8057 = DSM 46488]|uniref:STAS domain-containing protein n=1 Tax=Streptantibioticus cattleyicolor (strain ATCC 35852 / DSM 46488 / JCM 4925 / NBRC 14057 / NRRL 8057) TaxID=1003195 RepID=G8XET0_STREN|nr:hypothetical protein SCATT_p11600 [Streptantibioticus cattleyicolor NRRL 8057 = DSM 46488]